MDFSKFDTSAQAEAGRAFDILHPVTGKPMEADGKVARMIIRAPTAQTARKMPARSPEFATVGEMIAHQMKTMALFVAGFENVERDGRPATADDAEWFLGLIPAQYDAKGKQTNKTFVDQVVAAKDAFLAELGNVVGG